jgi:hypothetical protein
MKRMWPEEFSYVLDNAEEVLLEAPAFVSKDGLEHDAIHRRALKIRLSLQDFERIWPLAEARYRLGGRFAGKAITLIANNPHYHSWHPADGGAEDATRYVIAHFLFDDVSETAVAA